MDKNNFFGKISFTLIELLIVISVIFLISGISLAFYNQFNEQKKLEIETEKLVDVLELAKKKTSSAEIGNYTCTNFSGYQVNITALSYKLILCCSADCSVNYLIQSYNLTNNIIIIDGLGSVQFKPLTAGVVGTNTIILKNSTINKCQQISISSAGVISSEPGGC